MDSRRNRRLFRPQIQHQRVALGRLRRRGVASCFDVDREKGATEELIASVVAVLVSVRG